METATTEPELTIADSPATPTKGRVGRPIGTKEYFNVRVTRLNEHPENANLIIVVNPVGHKKKVFRPGAITRLDKYQINVLKDAVEETIFDIPDTSSVYEMGDVNSMKAAAEQNHPGMTARYNFTTGTITMVLRKPKYAIEYVEDD